MHTTATDLDAAVENYKKKKAEKKDATRREATAKILNRPTSSFVNTNLPPSPRMTRIELWPDKPNKATNHNTVEDISVPHTLDKLQRSPIRYSSMRSSVPRFATKAPITGGPGQYVDRNKRGLRVQDPMRPMSSFCNSGEFTIPDVTRVKHFPSKPRSGDIEYQHSSLFGSKGYRSNTTLSMHKLRMAQSSKSIHAPENNNTVLKNLVTAKLKYSQSFRSSRPRFVEPRRETSPHIGPGSFDHTVDGKTLGSPDFQKRAQSHSTLLRIASKGGSIAGVNLQEDLVKELWNGSRQMTEGSRSPRSPIRPEVPPRMGSEPRFSRSRRLRSGPASHDAAADMMAQTVG